MTLGDRSFSAAAPYLWNSLPVELRDIQSLAIYKFKLKTHLFRVAIKAYPVCYSLLIVLLIKFIIISINILFH